MHAENCTSSSENEQSDVSWKQAYLRLSHCLDSILRQLIGQSFPTRPASTLYNLTVCSPSSWNCLSKNWINMLGKRGRGELSTRLWPLHGGSCCPGIAAVLKVSACPFVNDLPLSNSDHVILPRCSICKRRKAHFIKQQAYRNSRMEGFSSLPGLLQTKPRTYVH